MSSFCYSLFFSKKFQYICVSLDVNFNESLTNDIVSFEQLGPECMNGESRPRWYFAHVQDDLNLRILRMFEGIFELEAAQMIP